MKFNVGDLIKRENGRFIYEIISFYRKNRFGKPYMVKNLTNGSVYNISTKGFIIYKPLKPTMDKEILRHNFKHGF